MNIHTTTQKAIAEAEKKAAELGKPVCVHYVYSPAHGYAVGRIQFLSGKHPRSWTDIQMWGGHGRALYAHNVCYIVWPCGSVWDTRMKIGLGSMFKVDSKRNPLHSEALVQR